MRGWGIKGEGKRGELRPSTAVLILLLLKDQESRIVYFSIEGNGGKITFKY